MAGPGGAERGRISIRVLPNTANFSTALERYLNRIERRLRVQIPTVLDTDGLERAARDATRAAERSAGRVRIPVDVDRGALDGLRDLGRQPVKLAVDNRQANRSIGEVRSGIESLAQRIRDIRTLYSASVGPANDFVSSTAKIAIVGGAASAALLGGAGLVGGLTAFTAAATAAAGAAPLIVPGLASLLAVSGTLKVALSGVGDALEDAIGKDAFKKISPQAERFVKAIKAAVPQVQRLRLAVQDAFFAKLADQVAPLAERYLPEFQRQAVALASVLNGSLRRGLASINNSTDQWRLGAVLQSARRSLSAFSPVIERLPRLLLRVGESAAPAFGRLADRLAGALGRVFDRLDAAAASGGLGRAIDTAVQVTRDLFSVLGSVLRVVQGIGRAASRAFGESFTSPIAGAAKAFADLVNAAPAQDFLTGLFATARPILAEVGSLLGLIAGSIGDLLPTVAGLAATFLQGLRPVVPVAERLATALGGALIAVLPAVSDVAVVLGETLAGALEALAPSLPIIAGGLAAMAQAIGSGLQDFFTTLAPILPGLAEAFASVAISLGQGLAGALGAIAPRLPVVAEAFVALAGALAQVAPSVIAALADAFVAIAPDLPAIAAALADIALALASLTPAAVGVINGVAGALAAVSRALTEGDTSTKLATFVSTLLALQGPQTVAADGGGLTRLGQLIAQIGVSLTSTNPQLAHFVRIFSSLATLDVAGLAAQISGPLVAAFTALPGAIQRGLVGVVPVVVSALGGLRGLVTGFVGPLPGLVAGILGALPPMARARMAATVAAVRVMLSQMPGAAGAAVAATPGRVLAVLSSLPGITSRVGVDAVARLAAALTRAGSAVSGALAGVPAAVVGALAAVAGAAFSAGANIVSSIASGLRSRIGEITSAAAGIAGAIKDFFPNSPVAAGPLRVLNSAATNPGGQVAKMLAAGLRAEAGAVRSAAELTAGILASTLTQQGGVDTAVRDITGVVAAAASQRYATPAATDGRATVQIDALYAVDMDEAAKKITRRQEDAAAVYSLAALAAVGG